MPKMSVIQMVGDAFRNAQLPKIVGVKEDGIPFQVEDGIAFHVDIGEVASGSDYAASNYVIKSGARGGEAINERESGGAAVRTDSEAIPDYPGTVAWKKGFQFLRDQPLNYPDEVSCAQAPLLSLTPAPSRVEGALMRTGKGFFTTRCSATHSLFRNG